MDYKSVLSNTFGFSNFRPGQEQIIVSLLNGSSALAVFPTGSGKSLCYQLPALLLPGLTIVVSPLLALMKDQVEFLQRKGVAAARMDSTLSADETQAVYHGIADGSVKVLYVAPERMSNERFVAAIANRKISMMVIDEAHCISEWGHNFRPEYLKLAVIGRKLNVERVLALTATATQDVITDICREFSIPPEAYVNTGFYRPNLTIRFTPTPLASRKQQLLSKLQSLQTGPTIVYVTLQKTAYEVAAYLAEAGLAAKPYHAGLKNEDRAEIQDWFMQSDNAVVVATIAFGMGIDKQNIRYVYHFNLPKTLENYSQEIGRAGRDGNPSLCEVLGDSSDITILENFSYGDTPTEQAVYYFLDFLMKQQPEFDLSLYEMAATYDIRPLVLNTVLTYCELEKVIQFTKPFYSEYKVKFIKPEDEICAMFKGDRAHFLSSVFKLGKKGRTWLKIIPNEIAESMGEERMRIIKALNYLEEKGLINIQVAGLRQGFRITNYEAVETLYQKVYPRILQNETRAIERTSHILDLINHNGCKVGYLLGYFGEHLQQNCGHCEFCLTGDTPYIERSLNELSMQHQQTIADLIQKNYPELGSPRQLARFLCGLSSPAVTRSKLTKDPLYGSLEHVSFGELLNFLNSLATG